MREMKDSGIEWIGQIPQEWDVQRGKYTFNVLSGFAFPSSDFSTSEGIPLIRIRDITSGVTETFFKGTYSEEFLVDDGDLLIGMDGDFGIRVWDNGQALLNQRCCKIIAKEGNSLKYLYYVLPYELKQINDLAFFTTVKHLSTEDLALVNVPLPSTDEQKRIAEYLDAKCAEIDALIAAKEKTNALLKERRQSIIYEAVTKGLNPDAPMKDSGIEWIGQIPSKWNMIRIKHLRNGEENSFEDGDWIEAPYISETGIRYLTTGNIGDGTYKEQGNGFVTQETFDTLKCKYAYPGDLVFSRLNAPYGRACILPNLYPEYVLAVDNVILRTDHSKKFLCYLTQCAGYQRMVEEKANGTTMKRISRTNLGDIALPIPTLVEQEAIAKYLENECAATDAVIFANEVTIQKLKEYRQSIIYEAVTGKIEV